jgi:hypothetical protein
MRLRDGKISGPHWRHAGIHIVHLLKQGVTRRSRWDLSLPDQIWRDFRCNPHHLQRKWHVSALCAYGLFSAMSPFSEADEADEETVLWPCLMRTAVVNLVKSTGGDTIANANLAKLASADWPAVRRQLRQLKPHVVICGGAATYQIAAVRLLREGVKVSDAERRGWFCWGARCVFVKVVHPQRSDYEASYQAVCGAVGKAMAEKRLTRWWHRLERRAAKDISLPAQHPREHKRG